jgi:hypothetical protein
MTKIEAFWVNATADDVARVMKGETVEARFRDDEHCGYTVGLLAGWTKGDPSWLWRDRASGQSYFEHCQVYREPSWHANKPDPGPGYRLLEKFPDEPKLATDEAWNWDEAKWQQVKNDDGIQEYQAWYRRRIEPEPKFAVGRMVRVVGPKGKLAMHWSEAMDEHIGQVYTVVSVQHHPNDPSGAADFYTVRGVVNWAFREDHLEAVEPVEKKPLLIRRWTVDPGDEIKLPNGRMLVISQDGFEVTQ